LGTGKFQQWRQQHFSRSPTSQKEISTENK
jgi:hypothetical protein